MCVRKISAQCVLQFTPSLAAGCVLHRPVSRVIHCSELFIFFSVGSGFLPLLCVRDKSEERSPPPGERLEEIRVRGSLPSARSPDGGTWLLRAARGETPGLADLRGGNSGVGSLFEPSVATWRHPLSPAPAAGNRHPMRSARRFRGARGVRKSLDPVPGEGRTADPTWGVVRITKKDVVSPRGVTDGNDPSAGSPTETLLRLLLPLNDQVWSSFRHAGATLEPLREPVRRPH